MGSVYIIRPDGVAAMNRIRCNSEDRELQAILEQNPDLLPGDQIDPEDPRRWLLIKREKPVPDPNSGVDRWSIDFFFADQDAIPTFVECKRFADTRSRREVVGQMVEYAANGHHYWDKERLRQFAEDVAKAKGGSLDDAIRGLRPTDDLSVADFFERIQQNLREGQLRIIFFLEESPMELRSVVDFLNKQMERSEVLLVEARTYCLDTTRIVVPTLFGYTEEARQVKRTVTVKTAASRTKWDKALYFADAQSKLGLTELRAVELLYDECVLLGCDISWGTGLNVGSFSVKEPVACPRSFITVYSDGQLSLNFHWLQGTAVAEQARRRLRELVVERTRLQIPDAGKFPSFSIGDWSPETDALIGGVKEFIREIRAAAVQPVAADVRT